MRGRSAVFFVGDGVWPGGAKHEIPVLEHSFGSGGLTGFSKVRHGVTSRLVILRSAAVWDFGRPGREEHILLGLARYCVE